jgi:hypothetical protein
MDTDMKTYFITDGTAIKIGKSSLGGTSRVKEGTMNPRELELIGEIDGDYEKELHRKFASIRLRGEWFRPTPELLAEIGGRCNKSVEDLPDIQEICSTSREKIPYSWRYDGVSNLQGSINKHPCLIQCDHAFRPNEHEGWLDTDFYEWWNRYFTEQQEQRTGSWYCLSNALNEKINGGATREQAHDLLSKEGWEFCEECPRCTYSSIGFRLDDGYILQRVDAVGVIGLGYVVVYLQKEFAKHKDSMLHKKLENVAWELDNEGVTLQINYVDTTTNQVTEEFLPPSW